MKKLVAIVMFVGALCSVANADVRIVKKSYSYASTTSLVSAQDAFEMIVEKRSEITRKNKKVRRNAAYDNCRLNSSRDLKVGTGSVREVLVIRDDVVFTAWNASVGYTLTNCTEPK